MPELRTSDRERYELLDQRALNHLAVQLRQLRQAAGLSQAALACAAKMSRTTIRQIERQTIDPCFSTVKRLARTLGVSLSAFGVPDSLSAQVSEEAPKPKRNTKTKEKPTLTRRGIDT